MSFIVFNLKGGINRYSNLSSNKFLKANLKHGTYGGENSSFIEVETVNCTNSSIDNPWQREVQFLKEKIPNIDNKNLLKFFHERISQIEEAYSNEKKGMHCNLFLPRLLNNGKFEELKIRRNSAFYSKDNYSKHVSQSDVYFNIAFVLNRLRNSEDNSHNLKQSAYVRNLLSPSNLNRFNDGIIQASILRSSTDAELNYSLDDSVSREMCSMLITTIKYWQQEQGEALLEFLLALASKKMKLVKSDTKEILNILEAIKNPIVKFYAKIINENLKKDDRLN